MLQYYREQMIINIKKINTYCDNITNIVEIVRFVIQKC